MRSDRGIFLSPKDPEDLASAGPSFADPSREGRRRTLWATSLFCLAHHPPRFAARAIQANETARREISYCASDRNVALNAVALRAREEPPPPLAAVDIVNINNQRVRSRSRRNVRVCLSVFLFLSLFFSGFYD